MTQEEQARMLSEILSSAENVEQLKQAGSVADVQSFLVKKGMDVTYEDTEGIVADIMQAASELAPEGEELQEDELEAVSGGSVLGIIKTGFKMIGGAWNWAKGMQDKNSNTYKATKTIVDFWSNVFGRRR